MRLGELAGRLGIERRKQQAESRRYAAFNGVEFGSVVRVNVARVFGQNVYRLRLARGLTQEQLSEKAELDRSYLQRIEKGDSNPTVKVAVNLRRALRCKWDDLFARLD